MGPTTDDNLAPLGPYAKYVIMAKTAVKVMAYMVPAIVAAWISLSTAVHDAKVRTQATKDLSEAGYQVTKHAVDELQHRVQTLEEAAKRRDEAEAAALHRGALRSPRRSPVVPVPPLAVVVGKTRALPSNLDVAKQAVYQPKPAQPAGAPPPDAN